MAASQLRSRLVLALRWLGPSALAGCAGSVVAGLVEGRGADGRGALAIAGFVAILALPALFAASVVVRAVVAAWRPRELAASLLDADGAAPRLAGWVAVIWLGALGLGAAMFQSVWVMAVVTAFKPLAMSYAEPVFAVATALLLIALSRPCARLFAWIANRVDAPWRRRGHRTLLRPRVILATAAITALAMAYLLWRVFVRHRLTALDTRMLVAPAAGVLAVAAMHALWPRLRRSRAAVTIVVAAAVVAVIAIAIFAWRAPESLMRELRVGRPLAGFAIDALTDDFGR